MGTVESRQRHQMHLVKLGANKSVQVRDPQGRIWGCVVRRRVMSCIAKCRVFLLAAGWVDAGRSALQSAEQRCQ